MYLLPLNVQHDPSDYKGTTHCCIKDGKISGRGDPGTAQERVTVRGWIIAQKALGLKGGRQQEDRR